MSPVTFPDNRKAERLGGKRTQADSEKVKSRTYRGTPEEDRNVLTSGACQPNPGKIVTPESEAEKIYSLLSAGRLTEGLPVIDSVTRTDW